MANFYTDNNDIQFLFRHIDIRKLATVCEDNFKFASEFDYAPADADEAIQNYDMVLDSLGQLAEISLLRGLKTLTVKAIFSTKTAR